jgi:IS5 family transposase
VQAAGGATRTRVRDRSRSAGRRAREIGSELRLRGAQARDEAQATVRRITGELAELAEKLPPKPRHCWSTPVGRCAAPSAKASQLAAAGQRDPVAGR